MTLPRVLVTGVSGFVGRALLARLLTDGFFELEAALRSLAVAEPVVLSVKHTKPQLCWG
jgi:uncharacterized protein YbjT (DUF2867 family)